MKTNKRLVAAAALLLVGGAAFAQSKVSLSGFVDLNLEYLKDSGKNGSLKRISSGGAEQLALQHQRHRGPGWQQPRLLHHRADVLG